MDSLINLEAMYINHEGKASDKWLSYFACYDRVFAPLRDQGVSLLEIGVQNGGSLEIWAKYFPHAQAIIGCDINEKCGELEFDDGRIAVVVGNATRLETRKMIVERCPEFDIIIDDGSHTSSDIVDTFFAYFSLLRDDGIFVAEDLACSYWKEYEGGLYSATSSVSFFKLLADYVNREAWGVPVDAVEFFGRSGFDVSEHLAVLNAVQSIEFAPSMCIVHKAQGENSGVGPRVIAGKEFQVQPAIQAVAGQRLQVPTQVDNLEAFPGGLGGEVHPPRLYAQLYTAPKGEGYSEAASSSASFNLDDARIELHLAVSQPGAPIEGFRLDLANQPVAVLLHRIALHKESGEALWSWSTGRDCFHNVRGLVFNDQPDGLMVVCLNNDPQLELIIPQEILTCVDTGTCLVVEMTAKPLLEVLPLLLEQHSSSSSALPRVTQSTVLTNPSVINELGETTLLFRQVVERRNATITRQREQLHAQEITQQQLIAQLHKAEAQLDVLKEFVAAAYGNTKERI